MESPVSTMFSAMMPFIVCMSSTSAYTPLSERPSCGQGYADCVPFAIIAVSRPSYKSFALPSSNSPSAPESPVPRPA